jgi:hypothetical protein
VIPDVIDAGTQEQDALIRECPAELLPFGVAGLAHGRADQRACWA